MKIIIELQENLVEDEIIMKCKKIDSNIQKIQQVILDVTSKAPKLSFYKDDKEYYISIDEILFFETSDKRIDAHTANEVYNVKYRLYELEEVLSHNFTRVSKSTILNVNHIFSINRSLTSSNLVQFYKSHKQVYVSRYYYKILKDRLEERRNYEN